jgi:prefoldin subunit 5
MSRDERAILWPAPDMPTQQLERRIAALEASVRRIEALEATIRRIEALTEKQAKELQIQFQRTAQIQAELDERRIASENVKESLLRRRHLDH